MNPCVIQPSLVYTLHLSAVSRDSKSFCARGLRQVSGGKRRKMAAESCFWTGWNLTQQLLRRLFHILSDTFQQGKSVSVQLLSCLSFGHFSLIKRIFFSVYVEKLIFVKKKKLKRSCYWTTAELLAELKTELIFNINWNDYIIKFSYVSQGLNCISTLNEWATSALL